MNTFGRLLRVSIYGESHGPSVGVIIDGCPPGIEITDEIFEKDLKRRKAGAKGTTTRIEADKPVIKSGVYRGRTTGTPIMTEFENKQQRSKDYNEIAKKPRPGHGDLVSHKKYFGFNDPRGGGHNSGRLTAGLVAAGAIAKQIISDIAINAALVSVAGSTDIKAKTEEIIREKDSAGGVIECRITNVPAGLGEPFFDKTQAYLSHLIFSIPGIKGLEFGTGFNAAAMKGSEFNDEIEDLEGKTGTNHSGGINSGITNGNEIIFKVAVKPTSTIGKKQRTVDITTGERTEIEYKGRHDACFALRLPPVIEAAAAIALADLWLLRK